MKEKTRKNSEKVESMGGGEYPTPDNPRDRKDKRMAEARIEIDRYLRYMDYRCRLEGY